MINVQNSAQVSVDVWFWDNSDFSDKADEICQVLSASEIARGNRYASREKALHWSISRAKVREHLGRITKTRPSDLVFEENAYGQLSLASAALPDLSFSISHDGAYSVLAVSQSAAVGVDLESVQDLTREEMDWPLSPTERRHLSAVPSGHLSQAFFRYWTLKEAFIKALGLGVSFPLHDFDMTPFDREPGLLRVKGDPDAPRSWVFDAREYRPNLRLALAVNSRSGAKCTYYANHEAETYLLERILLHSAQDD